MSMRPLMKSSAFGRPALLAGALLLGAGCVGLLASGCGPTPNNNTPGAPIKIKVAYLGLTCEAPIFVAKEKGFYEEEGLDVHLEKTDWNNLHQGLGLGKFDANHTLIMYLLKPIEGGTDVKITGGIHTGCLRVQAGNKTEKQKAIKSVKDLKGMRMGVPTNLYSPPSMFTKRVLAAAGLNPSYDNGDLKWIAFPPSELELALATDKVDAVCTSDPIGSVLLGKGVVRTIADQAEDAPYKDEFCCAVVVSGKLAKENPTAAAKVTRALLKAAKWVGENPRVAAELSVEKYQLPASLEVNKEALSKLHYIPGVTRCRDSISQAAAEMKKAGLLNEDTDPDALTKRAWLDLPDVTDKWLEGVKVAKLPDGRRPILTPAGFAALCEGHKVCCGGCCCVGE